MPLKAYKVLCQTPPEQTDTRLTVHGGTQLKVCGKTTLETMYEGNSGKMEFVIVSENVETLSVLPTLRDMRLIQQAEAVSRMQDLPPLVSKYAEAFEGLGRLPGTYRINLRKDAQPVIQPARRVPFKYRQQLQHQLSEMVRDGMLAPVTEATQWESPIVLVNKPGKDKLRICMDPAP